MLGGRESQGAVLWPRPVNHADVFVRFRDAVDVQEPRSDQRAGAGFRGRRSFAEQFDFQPALFLGLTQRGRFRVFVQLDMSAQWQPLVQVAMVNEQDLALMDNEDGGGEVNLFVNVSHTLLCGEGWRASIGKPLEK